MNPIACCFGRQRKRDESPTYNEKSSLIAAERAPRTESEVATDVVNVLLNAEKPGKTLSNALDDTVKGCSWTSRLAEAILGKLEAALKAGAQMSQVMKDAVEKATAEAYDFAKEHPVYCTIIALGVLCLLWPWALEALGFGEAGIMEGSLAARWQSLYPYVPRGSVFSFLQRLGMTWRHRLNVGKMEYRGRVE